MGGGGGSGYSGMSHQYAHRLENAYQQQRDTLNSQIDGYLSEILASANAHDTDLIKDRLNSILDHVADKVEVETLLYGGSLAKQTAHEGISDVDALVVIDKDQALSASPQQFIKEFADHLYAQLDRSEVAEVRAGQMAVTVVYRDGMEVQILPAARHDDQVLVGSQNGSNWRATEPKVFREALTAANESTNGALIRAIKLFKAINSRLPDQKQLSGYHIEALAVESARNYDGPRTPRHLLGRFLEVSSDRVLRPIGDMTGQSRFVDAGLGPAESPERRVRSQALQSIKRRLDAAASVGEWRSLFGE